MTEVREITFSELSTDRRHREHHAEHHGTEAVERGHGLSLAREGLEQWAEDVERQVRELVQAERALRVASK
jgi:hypothetical protein